MMFSSSSSYDHNFPPLGRNNDPIRKIQTKPFVTSLEILLGGTSKPATQVEEVLNWQTENSLAQNRILQKIYEKVDFLEQEISKMSKRMQEHYKEVKKKLGSLQEELGLMKK